MICLHCKLETGTEVNHSAWSECVAALRSDSEHWQWLYQQSQKDLATHRDWFADVLDFHKRFRPDQIGSRPAPPEVAVKTLRAKLIKEEITELTAAYWSDDLAGIADAIGDSIYVLIGMAVAYGIDLRPVWGEVHRTNMAKVGGPARPDGKVLKPHGWQPPDISGLLAKQEPLAA